MSSQANNVRTKKIRKFSRHTSLIEVKEKCAAKGWQVDTTQHDVGGDWIVIYPTFTQPDAPQRVMYASFNGKFMANTQAFKSIVTEASLLDGTDWFDELLDVLYVEEVA